MEVRGSRQVRRFADAMAARRQAAFVGRAGELARWRDVLRGRRYLGVWLHGPGGIGKSALLDEMARRGRRRTVVIDASSCASPSALTAELAVAIGVSPARVLDASAWPSESLVVMIDAAEALSGAAAWLRARLVPALPATARLVIASRHRMPDAWRADPGLAHIFDEIALGPLSDDEARRYLAEAGVEPRRRDAALALALGNPLVLSLCAELARDGELPATIGDSPDLVHALVRRIVDHTPSPAQRAALDALALARSITEPVLAAMLGGDTASLVGWLTTRSFVRTTRDGLVPHDLAREVLAADLRWRNRDRMNTMRSEALAVYLRRLGDPDRDARQRAVGDAMFLYREHPVIASYAHWRELDGLAAEPLRADDIDEIRALVERHEGSASAELAAYWANHQPQGVDVIRDAARRIRGVNVIVRVDQIAASERARDPVVARVVRALVEAGVAPDAPAVLLHRFWLDAERYHDVSPVQQICSMLMAQAHVDTSDVTHAFGTLSDYAPYRVMLDPLGYRRVDDVEVGGHAFTVVWRDWRAEPPLAMLAATISRIVGATPAANRTLSRAELERAVRDGLRHATAPHRLVDNPLASTPLARERASTNRALARGEVVRALLDEAVAALATSPRGRQRAEAITTTYLQPVGSQEAAAEALGLAFSTYRRYLAAGIEEVVDILHRRYADVAAP